MMNRDEDEISLVDIIRFFSRNGKFLALITVGLSAIAIIISLRQPKHYQKQLTLLIKPTSIHLSTFPTPLMDINQAGALAVKFLQTPKLDQVTAEVKYDAIIQQLDLTLRSPNPSSLTNASSKIVSLLETRFGEILSKSLENSQISVELQLKKNKRILDQLQQQKNRFSPTNQYRIGALEPRQAEVLANMAQLEFDKQYLQQARKNLADFTSQVIPVQILTESDVPPQTRSPTKVVVIAVIASFFVAVLAAIIRDQLLRLKQELSQQKPHGSSNV
jgi:uncharacterized protein involved in exopolysaccharide biosynthesis